MKKFNILTLQNIFGNPYEVECEVVKRETKGFHTPGGGWALYGRDGEIPAEWIFYRKKRQRRIYKTLMTNVVKIEAKE